MIDLKQLVLLSIVRVRSVAYPEGGLGGFKPPLNLQNFFQLCVCEIYCPSSATILIKSKIVYWNSGKR